MNVVMDGHSTAGKQSLRRSCDCCCQQSFKAQLCIEMSLMFGANFMNDHVAKPKPYPLVNQHSNGKSPFLMGKSTINGHFPLLC